MTADPIRTLAAVRAVATRRAEHRPTTPAELAARLIPGYVVTPTIKLLSDVLADAITGAERRIIISTPPRTGKSVLVSQVGPVFALMNDPDAQIIVKSYGDELAEEHSREARRLINENPDLLGIRLAADKSSVGRWRVEGHKGGMLAGGILSGTTGFGSSLLLLDDPLRGAAEADSAAHRRRLMAEFKSSLLSRLHPGASCVIVMTRWSELDLAGELLAEPGSPWTHVNIPAVSEAGIPDALHRAPGVAMVSALGRTAEGFAEIKRAVGQRAWAALYLGAPSSPEGGLVKREWLDTWRLPAAPPSPTAIVVGVDPSDSGSGDSCGLVVASRSRDGVIAVIADESRPMTSDQWASAAVQLALDTGASEIAIEGFAARETYLRVVREALSRVDAPHPIKVSSWPPKGSGRGGGDSMARSAALLQGLEVGTVRLAGHFPRLEERAVAWQAGQHQPDALAALVVAHDVLVHFTAGEWSIAAPVGVVAPSGDRRITSMAGYLARRTDGRGGYDPLANYSPVRRSIP